MADQDTDLEWKFEVDYVQAGSTPIRIGSGARLADFEIYRRLRDSVQTDDGLHGPYYNDLTHNQSVQIKGRPDDFRVQNSISELEKLGWTPVFQGMATPDQWDRHYPIQRTRPGYPLDSSNWLLLADAGGDGGIILRLDENGLVVITRPEWAKKKSHCLNLLWCELAVSQQFKDSFEEAGLTGAVFRPITYVPCAPGFNARQYPDKPLPPCNRIYWMDSDIVAPWSRFPRRLHLSPEHPLNGTLIGRTNDPLVGHQGDVGFDNEGIIRRGIDYDRAALEAMEGVDFMRMAEWAQQRNGVWRSYHLVSQKFRKWAHKFGCRFRMNGVKLVD